jgi:DNA-binding beta-propeller fold protein YncE
VADRSRSATLHLLARRLALTLTAALTLALCAAPARAAVTHTFLSQITEVPAGTPIPGSLGNADDMAVDSGRLYVAEGLEDQSGRQRIDVFDSSNGAFVLQFPQQAALGNLGAFGLAVGHEAGQVYVGAQSEGQAAVAVFDTAGSLLGTWTGFGGAGVGVVGVAADNSSSLADWAAGDVYVADRADGTVRVLKPLAGGAGEEEVARLSGPQAGVPFVFSEANEAIAVDPRNGDLYVADGPQGERVVEIFEPVASMPGVYALLSKITAGPNGSFNRIGALSVDASNGDVYVTEPGAGANVVYQFDAAGRYLGQLAGTLARGFLDVTGVAVDAEAPHHLFVGDFDFSSGFRGAIDVYGPNLVIPDVTSEDATEVAATSATLNGTVNPLGEGQATCRFVWGEEEGSLDHSAACPSALEGEEPIAVHVALEGLRSDTTYFFRLQATNSNGTNAGEARQTQRFTTAGPGIGPESASDVAATSATLNATIDPHSEPTSYYFQYSTADTSGCGASGCAEIPPAPGTDIGAGEGPVQVSQHPQGLSPGTTYHYRVAAVSALGSFYGPDQTFTTQTAHPLVLLDGRRWEMVSPPDKHGGLLQPVNPIAESEHLTQASADGRAMTYASDAPSESEPQGYDNLVQLLSARAPDGWHTSDVTVAHVAQTGLSVAGQEYRFSSEDLSRAVVQPLGGFLSPSLSDEASELTAFAHDNYLGGVASDFCTHSCYHPLVTGCPPAGSECRPAVQEHANVPPGTVFGMEGQCPPSAICGPQFIAATPDMRHVVLSSGVALTATPLPTVEGAGKAGLYEWSEGSLALVSVLPGPGEQAAPLAELGDNSAVISHAVSDDGSRVIWNQHGGHLYMRLNPLRPQSPLNAQGRCTVSTDACTLQLDAIQGGDGAGEADAEYQAASSDASKVFFIDQQRLTGDAGGAQQRDRGDLYECEIILESGSPACRLKDLTPLRSGDRASVASEVLGASDDGSYIYFMAEGALAEGARPGRLGGCSEVPPPPGTHCNLYVSHDGHTTFIADLAAQDQPDWGESGGPTFGLKHQTARVSPSGRWIAFMSQQDLTGYDTRDAVSGKPTEEVYLYDASSGRLTCASCNPSGGRPGGVEATEAGGLVVAPFTWVEHETLSWLSASVPTWSPYTEKASLHQPRYLSDSGRLFFDSHDALSAQDVNGTWDVYEFEPPGVGDCTVSGASFSARSGGCVGLVSSGAAREESAFMDASESGEDVFFLTPARLLSQDFDTSLDLYDAHSCSEAAPCLAPAPESPPPCDTGDSCVPAPTPQPQVFGPTASATFSGSGNVTPPRPPAARAPTRAQRLAKALASCRRRHARSRSRRAACERAAHRLYGSRRSSKTKTAKTGRRR